MLYYLSMFLFVIIITFIGEMFLKNNHKIISFVFFGISILTIVLFSGFRADTVGTDVQIYILPQLNYSKQFYSIIEYISSSNIELLNSCIIYFFGKISFDTTIILSVYQFLTILPIYIALVFKRKNISITFGIFIYLFFLYHITLNIIRQSVAGSFLFLGYVLLQEKKYIKAAILSILSIMFHNSAFVIIIILTIAYLSNNCKKNSLLMKIGALTFFGILIFFSTPLLKYFSLNLKIIDEKYYYSYIERMDYSVNLFEFLLRSIISFFPIINFNLIKQEKRIDNFSWCVLIGLLFSFGTFISQYMIRLSYYFYYYYLIAIPSSINIFTKKDTSRYIVIFIQCLAIVFYWYIIYITWAWHETIPFMFK